MISSGKWSVPNDAHYALALFKRLGGLVVLFTLLRWLFYLHNHAYLPLEGLLHGLLISIAALRFDLSSIVYINALFIIAMLIPLRSYPARNGFYRGLLKLLFIISNGIAFIFELTDIAYFPYNLRRSIVSDFDLFWNTAAMIPSFLWEFWYLTLVWILLLFALAKIFDRTEPAHHPTLRIRKQFWFSLGSLALLGLMARGGLQLRPISPISAFSYVDDARLAPLLTNTSLSLLFSSQQDQLPDRVYFSPNQKEALFNLRRQYHTEPPSQKRNVFVIVLESFGVEHLGAHTPFLNGLLENSLQVEEAYANGLRSTQGILAITSSIPSLMRQPMMFSAYQTNRIDGLAHLLGEWGYQTAFFHGANPGSMEFERFAAQTGFDDYLDRDDFGDDTAYDGQWGIWDEPFFEYTVDQVDEMKEPFFGLLFSLTSHHPYAVPAQFKAAFPEEKAQLRAMRYTDDALEKFFEKARKMPWFDRTLFVLTADHTGRSQTAYYQGNIGRYQIPLAIYDPQNALKGQLSTIAQQIDIMPSVLDILGYDQPFAAFGYSLRDSLRSPIAYRMNTNWYHAINDSFFYEFDGFNLIKVFNYRKDPMGRENLIHNDTVPKEIVDTLKAIIQTHHQGMINNQLFLEQEQ